MSWRRFLVYASIYGGVILIDTAFMGNVTIGGISPDLPLLLLMFFAHYLGSMPGKLLGFVGGLVQDVLGLAPLGFHALLGTVIGHFSGLLQGRLYLDTLVLPALMALFVTVGKFIVVLTASLLFLPERVEAILSVNVFIEIGIHVIIAPFLYALLKLLRVVRDYERHVL
jgi:rod shape-determining protein MreD